MGSQIISFAPSPPSGSPASPRKNGDIQPTNILLPAATDAQYKAIRGQSPLPPTSSYDQKLPPISYFSPNTSTPTSISTSSGSSYTAPPGPPILKNPAWGEHDHSVSQPSNLLPAAHTRQTVSFAAYPSPADSGFGSPGMLTTGFNFNTTSSQMLPPINNPGQSPYNDHSRSPYNSAKRIKLSPRSDSFPRIPRTSPYANGELESNGNPSTPTNTLPSLVNPLTPAPSTISAPGDHPDDRRISVSSLLSEEPSDGRRSSNNTEASGPWEMPSSRRGSLHLNMITYSETETYGHDCGIPDLDIPKNNDTMAISGANKSENGEFDSWLNTTDLGVSEFGFGLDSRDTVFSKGGYYATPVPIKVPRKLEPLPATLSENPMNLLYFHHFLNHTAKILVPHDCPENPFKTVLPKSKSFKFSVTTNQD